MDINFKKLYLIDKVLYPYLDLISFTELTGNNLALKIDPLLVYNPIAVDCIKYSAID